jgi:hypothetical protein
VAIDIESELLFALRTSVRGLYQLWNVRTLLNFSNPPSVSSIVLIHCSALAYRCRSASLKGESQGSSWTTPEIVSSQLSATAFGTLKLTSPVIWDSIGRCSFHNGIVRVLSNWIHLCLKSARWKKGKRKLGYRSRLMMVLVWQQSSEGQDQAVNVECEIECEDL